VPDAYVYIISNKSHRIYVGWTTDLLARFHEHRNKLYPSAFTARYNFDRLVWFVRFDDVDVAMRHERRMKSWPRARKVALIQETNPNWLDLSGRLHWSSSLA
jgi:putative endonuclease